VVKYLPFHAANAVVATSGSFSDGNGAAAAAARLDPNTALLVVLAWLIGALAISAIFTERAEISGSRRSGRLPAGQIPTAYWLTTEHLAGAGCRSGRRAIGPTRGG